MYTEHRLNKKAAEESGIDIDWYFLDPTGKIAIVSSSGGLLPDSIASDMDRLKNITNHFRSLPVLSNDIIIEKDVLDEANKLTKDKRDAYLKDLYFMSSRGFYYFDKVELNKYFDFKYQLKAKPQKPLIIDRLDSDIRSPVPDIVIDTDLDYIKTFFVNELA